MDNSVKLKGTFEGLQVITDKVAKMTLKVKGYKDGDFDLIPITVFSKNMDDVKKLRKGAVLTVDGRLKSSSFMSKNGNEIVKIEALLWKFTVESEGGTANAAPCYGHGHDQYEDVPF